MCPEPLEGFLGLHLSTQGSARQMCLLSHLFLITVSACVSFLLTINYHFYHFSFFVFNSHGLLFLGFNFPCLITSSFPIQLTTFTFYSSTCRVPLFSVSVFSLLKCEDLIAHQPYSKTEHPFMEKHSCHASHGL